MAFKNLYQVRTSENKLIPDILLKKDMEASFPVKKFK
jgi:hypothetical protein